MRPAKVGLVLLLTSTAAGADPGDPASLATPAAMSVKAIEFLRQLDDDDVNVRDRASEELVKLGRHALPAARTVLANRPSAEVKSRVARLVLPAALADDFEARYPVFLADKGRKYDHDFLGWSALKAAAGDTEQSRALFADLLADENSRRVLLAAALPPEKAAEVFGPRWKSYGPTVIPGRGVQQGTPALHDIAAILLAETHVPDLPPRFTVGTVVAGLNAALKTDEGKLAAVGQGKYGPAFQAVCRAWVRTSSGWQSLQLAEALCEKVNLGNVLRDDVWLRVANDSGIDAMARQQYVLNLAGAGGRKYLDHFRRLLGDQTPIQLRSGADMQLRDMALVAAVLVTGQRPREYGFTVVIGEVPQHLFTAHNYNFKEGKGKTVGDLRKAAFAKWAEWEKEHLKSGEWK